MNRQSKSAIKSLVLTLRHKLEDEITIQLKRYGFAGERWLEVDRLPHIQRDDGATIEHFRLRATLEQHLRRIGNEPDGATAEQRAEAAGWLVREVASTHLNRLVALECLEARGLRDRSAAHLQMPSARLAVSANGQTAREWTRCTALRPARVGTRLQAICGKPAKVLAPLGQSTVYIERTHLTMHMFNSRLTRKPSAYSKQLAMWPSGKASPTHCAPAQDIASGDPERSAPSLAATYSGYGCWSDEPYLDC